MKILQSWDDGIVDDIRLIEILRKYDTTATFNLNIGLNKDERVFGWNNKGREVWRLSLKEMPDLYKGFEIAGHSMTHPYLTQCSDEALKYELFESRKILQDMFQQAITGFCYPFGVFNDYIKKLLVDAGYTHARGIEKANNVLPPNEPFEFNPHCHFLDKNFWSCFEEAQNAKSDYFFFWGHSYEFSDDKMWDDFESKIQTLSNDSNNEWVNIASLF